MTDAAPMIVTGMHRSCGSLVAGFLSAMGVDLEREATGGSSPRDLHLRLLAAAVRDEDGSLPEWGWSPSERLDLASLNAHRAESEAWLGDQTTGGRIWGWHDPLTTSLVDWWDDLAPDARYVLVYRSPWDVQASIQDLSSPRPDPDTTLRIWSFYNRRLLAFLERSRERCILVEGPSVLSNPDGLAVVLQERFGLTLSDPSPQLADDATAAAWVAAARLRGGRPPRKRAADEPVHKLLEAMPAEVRLLFGELDRSADVRERSGPSPLADLVPVPPRTEPRISVVIPCRDDGDVLVDALASVRLCRNEPVGVVLVDDGSEDGRTRALLGHLEHLGVHVERQSPRGVSAARNTGIRHTSAPYILPLDADNLLRCGWLTEAADLLDERDDIAVVHTDAERFGLQRGRWDVPPHDPRSLLRGNTIDTCALIRRTVLEAVGGYDERMPAAGAEDWELWLAFTEHGETFAKLDVVGFDYRVREQSLVQATRDPATLRALFEYVVAKHRSLYEARLVEVVADHVDAVVALRAQVDRLEARVAGLIELEEQSTATADELSAQRTELARQAQEIIELHAELVAAARQERILHERIAVLEDETLRHDRAADVARQAIAATVMERDRREVEHAERLAGMLGELERTRAAAHEQLAAAEARAEGLQQHLDAIFSTRTWRWLAPARRIYGMVRRVRGR